MESGMDYWKIQETDVFELIALLGSFNRKRELENSRQWFVHEVRRLIDEHTSKQKEKGSSNATLVNQDLIIDDLIAIHFEEN